MHEILQPLPQLRMDKSVHAQHVGLVLGKWADNKSPSS